jgi:uncharacterized membrane protein
MLATILIIILILLLIGGTPRWGYRSVGVLPDGWDRAGLIIVIILLLMGYIYAWPMTWRRGGADAALVRLTVGCAVLSFWGARQSQSIILCSPAGVCLMEHRWGAALRRIRVFIHC